MQERTDTNGSNFPPRPVHERVDVEVSSLSAHNSKEKTSKLPKVKYLKGVSFASDWLRWLPGFHMLNT